MSSKRKITSPKKPFLCVLCQETNPECFYARGRKSVCKTCTPNYVANKKSLCPLIRKDRKCKLCGVTDEKEFYAGRKVLCKKCWNK